MNLVSAALVAAFVFSSAAFAQRYEVTVKGPLPEIASYQEIASMPPYKRIAYIQGLQTLLIEMEQMKDKRADNSSFREAIAQLLQQLTIMDSAWARAPGVPAKQPSCPASFSWSPAVQQCVYARNGKSVGPPIAFSSSTSCPKNLIPVQSNNGSWVCMTQASHNNYLSNQANIGSSAPVVPKPEPKAAEPQAIEEKPKPDITKQGDRADLSDEEAKYRHEKIGDVIGCRNIVHLKDYDQEKYRDKLKNSKGSNCVMGGVFSTYAGANAEKGKCKPVTEYPPPGDSGGKVDPSQQLKCKSGESMCHPLLFCTKPAGGAPAAAKPAAMPQAPAKPVAEKPAAPSAQPPATAGKREAICLKVKNDLTSACKTESEKYGKCDPFAPNAGIPSLPEEWNSFKKNFDGLCNPTSSEFAAFFCKECQIMSERIRTLNLNNKGQAPQMPPAPTKPPEVIY